MQPVPIGAPGELHIGGIALGRGYLNRPEETAAKFIPDPFGGQAGGRLYKTGDLVRYRDDGNLEFLGRIDQQVKVRGLRIELGEIEAVLQRHPKVQEAVVVAREGQPATTGAVSSIKRLVGYVVTKPDQPAPGISELREHLQDQLPDYMVPAAFVMLEKLPLNTNGKVDRAALPDPDLSHLALDTAYVPPQTPTQQVLAGIWQQVLGLQQVGIHDNFFALGGDSILTIQIIARTTQAGLSLTPKQLFQHQTIAELAAILDAGGSGPIIVAEQEMVTGPVPLTPIQHWFFAQSQPQPYHYNQAVLLYVNISLDPILLGQALRHLLLHHDALRLRFEQTEQGWQQINAGEEGLGESMLRQVDLSPLPLEKQQAEIEAVASQAQASLNLREGPLLRAVYFDLGPSQPARLLIVIHHLAVDGVSWRILLEDLQSAYQQMAQGRAVQLPPKTTSFQYWALRLHNYAQSAEVARQVVYWLEVAQTDAAILPLDYAPDDIASVNTQTSAHTIEVKLDTKETLTLLQEVPQVYHTQINEILLSALALTFWTGRRQLLVDLEGHGREDLFEEVNLARTVGWFTSLFPVLLDPGTDFELSSVLRQIKEQVRHIPQHGIGYGLLRYLNEDSEAVRQMQDLPRAAVSFNYLGQFDQALASSSLWELAPEAIGSAQSSQRMRPHLLEINAMVLQGQLQVNWTYSSSLHKETTIEALASQFLHQLRAIIAHCPGVGTGGYTPSDFPLAQLDQPTLDRLLGSEGRVEQVYPLSAMQQEMLIHTLSAPGSGVYVEQVACQLQGQLDIAAFKRAWLQVVMRHAVLRTSFLWTGLDQPLQVVHQHVTLPWEMHDWRGLEAKEQQARLECWLTEDCERGFELSEAPLLRLSLIRLANNRYQFVWTLHHLLLDGWSLPLLLKEVFALYSAERHSQPLHLPRPRPYWEYIAWLQKQDPGKAEAYWRRALEGISAPTPLGADRSSRQEATSTRGYATEILLLPEAMTATLQQLARQHQLTLSTLVQGAWALLLSRYSGEEKVVFGVTVSGRTPELPEVETMLGLFINMLPVQVQVRANQRVMQWLQELQAQLVELRQYEYSSLAQVQKWSQVPGGLPLFESIVIFENYPVDETVQKGLDGTQLEEVQIQKVRVTEQNSYPLTVRVGPGQCLHLELDYVQERFELTTIRRILAHFQMLLEELGSNPEQHLGQLLEKLTLWHL